MQKRFIMAWLSILLGLFGFVLAGLLLTTAPLAVLILIYIAASGLSVYGFATLFAKRRGPTIVGLISLFVLLPLVIAPLVQILNSSVPEQERLALQDEPQMFDNIPPAPPEDEGEQPKDDAQGNGEDGEETEDNPQPGENGQVDENGEPSNPESNEESESGEGEQAPGEGDQPLPQPPRNSPMGPTFDFDQLLTLEPELELGDDVVLSVTLPTTTAYPERYRGSDQMPPGAHIRHGVASRFDPVNHFVSSGVLFDEDVPKQSRIHSWDLDRYQQFADYVDDAPNLVSLLNDNPARETVTHMVYLFHSQFDALYGLAMPTQIQAARLPADPRVVAAYQVTSEVIWPDGLDDAVAKVSRNPPMPGASFVEHYTELDMDPKYAALAQRLTENTSGWYEQARAIQDYLMGDEFSYSLEPGGASVSDRLEYFLFENKTGYCTYYAMAFTVLARAVGIPTRVAYGYLAVPENAMYNQYILTEREAHAWAEVWLPGLGWTTFEVTNQNGVNEDDLLAPPDQEDERQQILRNLLDHSPELLDEAANRPFASRTLGGWSWFTLALLCLILAALAALKIFRLERWWPWTGAWNQLERHLMAMISDLEDQGIQPEPGETLLTFAQRVRRDHGFDMMPLVEAFYALRYSRNQDSQVPLPAPKGELKVTFWRRVVAVFRVGSVIRAFSRMSARSPLETQLS